MKTKVGNDITEVVNLLKSGELVAIPTETVYGLAAIFYNEDAVK
ncbi:MAG: Sua5/YciO/YrdC/YwlC family protein, partial [Crocinitomicaceae bacterium]